MSHEPYDDDDNPHWPRRFPSRRSYELHADGDPLRPCLDLPMPDGTLAVARLTPLLVVMLGLDDPFRDANGNRHRPSRTDIGNNDENEDDADDPEDVDDEDEDEQEEVEEDGRDPLGENKNREGFGEEHEQGSLSVVTAGCDDDIRGEDEDEEAEGASTRKKDDDDGTTVANRKEEDPNDPGEEEGFDEEEEEEEEEDDECYYLYKDYDSADSDDEDNVIDAGEVSVEGAANVLRNSVQYQRYRYRRATVNLSFRGPTGEDEEDVDDDDDGDPARAQEHYAAQFRNFVHHLEGYPGVRHLELIQGRFDVSHDMEEDPEEEEDHSARVDDSGDEDDEVVDPVGGRGRRRHPPPPPPAERRPNPRDVDRLFEMALANHPSLRDLTFYHCRVSNHHWRLFTESIPAFHEFHNSLERLSLQSTPVNVQGGQLLGAMLRRGVMLFEVRLEGCGMDSDGWKAVCDGVAHNKYLGRLVLGERCALEKGTLLGAVALSSGLRRLEVTAGQLRDGAVAELIAALRTNTRLQGLTLYAGTCFGKGDAPLVEDLLDHHNWTLEDLALGPWKHRTRRPEIASRLERNHRVRFVHDRTLVPGCCRTLLAVWPILLQEVSTFPTLLQRFVRQNYIEAILDRSPPPPKEAPPNRSRTRGTKRPRSQDSAGAGVAPATQKVRNSS